MVVKQPINLIFERAGTLMLTRRTASGVLSTNPADIYVTNKKIVKSINGSVSKTTYDIESGNSVYPADTRTEKTEGKFNLTLNAYDRQLYRFATGAVLEEVTSNATFDIIGIEYVVPSTAPHKIVLPYVAKKIISIADYDNGEQLSSTTDSVGAGKYKFTEATNDIEFHTDMAGRKVVVSYTASASETSSDVLLATPVDYTYELKTYTEVSKLNGEIGTQLQLTIIDSVKFDGDITPPEKKNQAGDWSVSFKIVEPFGNKAVETKYVEATKLTAFTPAESE
jgi:hypothetical protein